ncbi:glycosyltransferase [Clostridium sp. 'deep sea']|uniref:glycosyltransferase n=1 Tax=Clostridium sp. 'deep sea' TaxID=2779445 RepID=UPI0018967B43|nr:glycosyltransferase [Clostridium sp. 'deep sea']QOR35721.1 glycosyltransferase [Clostridium sp. 'deep sea']
MRKRGFSRRSKQRQKNNLEVSDNFPILSKNKDSEFIKSVYQKGKIAGMRSILPSDLTYYAKKNQYPPTVQVDTTIHAFIAAKNEEATIVNVIENAFKAGVHKVIVVANGCTDNTALLALNCGAEVIEFKYALGYDVGRSIGLKHAPGDINIVLDADFVLQPEDLKPFIYAVANGVDIALNDLNPLYSKYAKLDKISILKYTLNLIIDRSYLGINSLTAVPHALSRKAVNILTAKSFAIPPKALVKAALNDLNIQAISTVDVFKPNIIRPQIHQNNGIDLAEELIIGDHLEAINYYLFKTNWRGGRTDLGRKRELVNE